jgi:hypothetical protein
VLRVPRSVEDRERTVHSIQQEYAGIGATQQGIGFRLRTIEEQAKFIDTLSDQSLKTVVHLDVNKDTMLLPFLSGVPLHIFAESTDTEDKFTVIGNILHHLSRIHQKGITYGDRWCTNTLVLTNGDFVELDYDIELIGDLRTIQSFEMAQTIYHLIHFSGRNRVFMTNRLQRFFQENADMLGQYDVEKLTVFLLGHAEYFHKDELYERITPPYDEIYSLANQLKELQKCTFRQSKFE